LVWLLTLTILCKGDDERSAGEPSEEMYMELARVLARGRCASGTTLLVETVREKACPLPEDDDDDDDDDDDEDGAGAEGPVAMVSPTGECNDRTRAGSELKITGPFAADSGREHTSSGR
jgi:hypothetical protein